MQLLKTDKAREELASRQRSLQLRERAALLLADGTKTRAEMQVLMQDDGTILSKLIADGYLAPATNAVTAKEGWNASTGSWSTSTNGMNAAQSTGAFQTTGAFKAQAARSSQTTGPTPLAAVAVPAAAPAAASAAAAVAAPVAADNFEGKRSLATTRMFLFDICERMFVRKLPAKANLYRDQLRAAKDRESMLAVARDMINDVEEIAGHDRADGISERIASLLPPE
ncbi:MAG: hypothetical protein ACKVIH_10425 [Burkholderiales bacterium]